MEVLNLSFPRTGTMILRQRSTIYESRLDQLLGDYKAVSADPPAVAFAEDLIEAYPEAKVILVERELESWFKSFDKAVIEPTWSFRMNFVADLDPFIVGPTRYCHRKWTTGWMRAKDEKEMREHARDIYREHYALVRRVTPKERLLEYRLGGGWEPLCEFLGKPVPNAPFPRVNDEEALREMLAIIARRGLWNFAKRLASFVAPCTVLASGWYLYYKRLA
ncbi:hypothetical protein B0A49_00634 [Cryomyces minteri]|uniref:Uncharacterized protein n=1 Tax=Cryomyces minteri TaxID=331657 RepID=A0A4U0XV83_9PEZI|nr:hypothetical protein B0A49_00634 [Cryomyces minteri]